MSIQALKIESKLQNVQNPADTHINACAVLSQLGRHQSALGNLHIRYFIINVYMSMSIHIYIYRYVYSYINACDVLSQLGRHQSALGILHIYDNICTL